MESITVVTIVKTLHYIIYIYIVTGLELYKHSLCDDL